ncbi:peptidase M23 [Bacteroidetes bacterium UKL13-3]|jgi:murein DD-endopeptidase MepM/ murein hydrolase activator NlpD|nr:peptidase M23 [Bacteroidetes bacterium UKL13-3]HCP94278.1 peptidase M23 [Bacteroidota bacterium]
MAKIKYFYNPHSLELEKVTTNVRSVALRVFGFLSASIVAGIILMLIAYNYIDSPKERILKREIEAYKLQTQLLSKKMNSVNKALADLQDKDANIYRAVFEAEPMPLDSEQFKTFNVEKYQQLMGYSNSAILIDLNQKMETILAKVAMQNKSFDELARLASRKKEFLAAIPAIQPVANRSLRKMASGFGYRLHPIYKTYKMHEGIDFTAPTGTPIYATGNGRVMNVDKEHRGYGNCIVINHGFGYQTLYGHMYRMKARPGQTVKRGELIGYVGNTGLSSGPHLHYEVIKNGKKINPINYFFNDLTEAEYTNMRELAQRPTQSFD